MDKLAKLSMSFQHKKTMEKYKGPYDCPKCFLPKMLTISKFGKTKTTTIWVAQCGKCGFWKKVELPSILKKIDVINKIGDLLRSEN